MGEQGVGAVAGAAVGALIGLPFGMFTQGAAVGWLVGAWLFGSDATTGNQIIDPGAQEIPRVNQSLRGVTMPILFGTNRVSSNIVWVKNFNTITHSSPVQSSGGGSGGGSNQNAQQVSYTYEWDMLFHIGMSPVPVTLFNGWQDSVRISSAVLGDILSGSSHASASATDGSEFSFNDSYFGEADATGAVADPWDYFEDQEGVGVRWPHTSYVGFKALDLGGSARVPQFSWEVGPLGAVSPTPVSIALTDFDSDTDAGTIAELNIPDLDVGAANDLRRVVFCISTRRGDQLTAVEANGRQCLRIAALEQSVRVIEIWWVSLPIGTEADVLLRWDDAKATEYAITVLRVINPSSLITVKSRTSSSANSITDSLGIETDGSLIAFVAIGSDTVAVDWTGAAEVTDIDAGQHRHSVATNSTPGSPLITADGGNGVGYSFLLLSFTPATLSDVTPPYIIHEILTNSVFGLGYSTDLIDADSYADAVAHCEGDGILVSVQYTREQPALAAIEMLLALYGGFLTWSGGILRFGVQRSTDEPVRTIDNHHLVPPSEGEPPVVIQKAAQQDGFNKVRVNYFDRDLEYRQNQVEVTDEVDIDFNGTRLKEFPPVFVMDTALANKVAERALWNNLFARDVYRFKLGWKDADLEPGDLVTLVDSFHPELQGGKRVRLVHWNEKARGQFDVLGVLEVPYLMQSAGSLTIPNSPGGGKDFFTEIAPPANFQMYELPREFQGANANLFVGYNALSEVKGAVLYLSADGINFTSAGAKEPFCQGGIFEKALPANDVVMRKVRVYLMPQSGFNPATPIYAQSLALDDISETQRAAGLGILSVGSEAMAMEGVTLIAQNYYEIERLYRGWGGTAVQAHASGAYWHRHFGGIFEREIIEDEIGNTFFYKVVPYNFAGQLYDIASIDAKEWTIHGDFWRPQGTKTLRMFVDSPTVVQPNTGQLRTELFRQVTSGGCDINLRWSDGARVGGFGAGGFGVGSYGHFNEDVETREWRVEVMSLNGVVVRSTVVTSPTYLYTRVANSADFTGFGYDTRFKVTPRNQYGDALYATSAIARLYDGTGAPPPSAEQLTDQSDEVITDQSGEAIEVA